MIGLCLDLVHSSWTWIFSVCRTQEDYVNQVGIELLVDQMVLRMCNFFSRDRSVNYGSRGFNLKTKWNP